MKYCITILFLLTPYVIEHCLVARKRGVVIHTFDDNGDVVVPDKIMIGSQLVTNGYKIKPGNYELTIEKSGYKTLVKNIAILADDMDFVIKEKLQRR